MKYTYLVYTDAIGGNKELRVATPQEWNEILKRNKGLSMEQRRHFILDCIDDDCMYIETSLAEYEAWHSKHVYKERIRKIGHNYQTLSVDAEIGDSFGLTLGDAIDDGIDYEGLVIEDFLMKELKEALEQWAPYGITMLDLYLSGKKRECTKVLSMAVGVSEQYMRRKKKEFEAIVKSFLIY